MYNYNATQQHIKSNEHKRRQWEKKMDTYIVQMYMQKNQIKSEWSQGPIEMQLGLQENKDESLLVSQDTLTIFTKTQIRLCRSANISIHKTNRGEVIKAAQFWYELKNYLSPLIMCSRKCHCILASSLWKW